MPTTVEALFRLAVVKTLLQAKDPMISFVNEDGSLYVTDGTVIKRLALDGTVTPFAGTPRQWDALPQDGPVATATFQHPFAIAKGPDGALYVADSDYIRVIRDGQVTTLAGHKYTAGEGDRVDGVGAAAKIDVAEDIWLEPGGRIMFWDEDVLRSVSTDGTVTTIANPDDPLWDVESEKHRPHQIIDKRGTRFFPPFSDETAIELENKDIGPGIMGYGEIIDDWSIKTKDGPIEDATFHRIRSFAYDRERDIVYFTDEDSVRQIQFGPSVAMTPVLVKRSVIGWSDPLTYSPNKSGDGVIKHTYTANGVQHTMYFDKDTLETWWNTRPANKNVNPLTRRKMLPEETTVGILQVEEDDDANKPPDGGRRRKRHRKTRRVKRRASKMKKMTRKQSTSP
jgi:hypothetical protein